MQTNLSRIWTQITMSISYDSNHYTTGASNAKFYVYLNFIEVKG